MQKILTPILWIKFVAVVVMFLVSFSLNFLIVSQAITSDTAFNLLLFGKPALVLVYLFVQNFIFHFPDKIPVPNLIPSVFLILSVGIFADLGFLIAKYFEIFQNHPVFWGVYGVVLVLCGLNLRKFVRAFTHGI